MSYLHWFEAHANKHHAIIVKLLTQKMSKEAIIDYFTFEKMRLNEPDFCPLYADCQKCHAMEKLNCYLCACPHFRFNDEGIACREGIRYKSTCAIASRKGRYAVFENVAHLDCSLCTVPHTEAFIAKHFDLEWKHLMRACLEHALKA